MSNGELLERLNEKYLIYKEEAVNSSKEGFNADYWEGKASGLLLAIEIIQGKWD